MVRFPAWTGNISLFQSVQIGCGTHLASESVGTGFSLRQYSGRRVRLTTYLWLVPELRMSDFVCLLPRIPSCRAQGQLHLFYLPLSFYLARFETLTAVTVKMTSGMRHVSPLFHCFFTCSRAPKYRSDGEVWDWRCCSRHFLPQH